MHGLTGGLGSRLVIHVQYTLRVTLTRGVMVVEW